MARILLTWELGAAYGHLARLRALAQPLKARGHECAFALRDMQSSYDAVGGLGDFYQAPIKQGRAERIIERQISYSSLLHNQGFEKPAELAGLLLGWQSIMRAHKTDMVYADHSPVAMIAAKTLGLPVCYVGTGFTLPPLQTPFPSFRFESEVPESALMNHESSVLTVINKAMEIIKHPPFQDAQEIFRGQMPGLLSYEEMDHYAVPRPAPYLGIADSTFGEAPPWPEMRGPKVFAYLRPTPFFEATLKALQTCRFPVLMRVSDVALEKLKPFLRKGMIITTRAIDFTLAASECDAFVNYAAHGTTCEFLLGGKPGVLTPNHRERRMVARRATQMGAVEQVQEADAEKIGQALEKVIQEPAYRTAAQGFAERYTGWDRSQVLPRLVQDSLAWAGLG